MLPCRIRLVALLLFVITGLATAAMAAPSRLLFDQGHGQRFRIEETGSLHLSKLAALFVEDGVEVSSSTALLTDESLAQVQALVISGPFATLAPAEVASICRFVERGGRLAVMLHIGQPVAELLHRLDVDFTNYVLAEQENIIGTDPKNFQVKSFAPHDLTAGIDHFSLYGGWALMNTAGNASIVAQTSPKAWVDLDGDRKLSPKDVVQSFGVLVAGTYGQGRFAIFGDDAIFQNQFLDEANRKLARNLIQWLR